MMVRCEKANECTNHYCVCSKDHKKSKHHCMKQFCHKIDSEVECKPVSKIPKPKSVKYNMMKVFDQSQMPKEAREQFVDYYEDKINDNAYIYHSVQSMYNHETKLNRVDKWLLENGADKDESVLINIYW